MSQPSDTAAPAVVAGPLCDICGDEFAVASLMMLGDYSQVKFGFGCGGTFLIEQGQALLTVVSGAEDAAAAKAPAVPATAALDPDRMADLERAAGFDQAADEMHSGGGSLTPPGPDDEPEPGSARDHWASTTNVRRSTHGHRRARGGQEDEKG